MANKRKKTPSEIMLSMIQAAMAVEGMTAEKLSKCLGVHVNTVYADLKDPDRIPQCRLWLYFINLDIPIQAALDGVATAFAESISRR